MQTVEQQRYTYDDYAQLPEGAPYQLIDGALIMSPSPTPYHQLIQRRLLVAFHAFVEESNLGEVLGAPIDVFLGETHTYQPDLLFIASERLRIVGEQRIEGPPDLVVEILSPSTAYYDLRQKKRIYAATGVKEYWIVDPIEKSIEIYENRAGTYEPVDRAEGDGAVTSVLLKGFSVQLTAVF